MTINLPWLYASLDNSFMHNSKVQVDMAHLTFYYLLHLVKWQITLLLEGSCLKCCPLNWRVSTFYVSVCLSSPSFRSAVHLQMDGWTRDLSLSQDLIKPEVPILWSMWAEKSWLNSNRWWQKWLTGTELRSFPMPCDVVAVWSVINTNLTTFQRECNVNGSSYSCRWAARDHYISTIPLHFWTEQLVQFAKNCEYCRDYNKDPLFNETNIPV